jgi:hypothetical protein
VVAVVVSIAVAEDLRDQVVAVQVEIQVEEMELQTLEAAVVELVDLLVTQAEMVVQV